MQAVQELQESICVNKEGVQEDTVKWIISEQDRLNQEETFTI
jgi:hypothetical protein